MPITIALQRFGCRVLVPQSSGPVLSCRQKACSQPTLLGGLVCVCIGRSAGDLCICHESAAYVLPDVAFPAAYSRAVEAKSIQLRRNTLQTFASSRSDARHYADEGALSACTSLECERERLCNICPSRFRHSQLTQPPNCRPWGAPPTGWGGGPSGPGAAPYGGFGGQRLHEAAPCRRHRQTGSSNRKARIIL